jgi:hypothetical protein
MKRNCLLGVARGVVVTDLTLDDDGDDILEMNEFETTSRDYDFDDVRHNMGDSLGSTKGR